jgi:hypothetical protein
MAVYFHGNFGLNRDRLAGLLQYGLENPELKDKELAQPFGYGAPYAQRYRNWLYRVGMTELGLPMKLTAMGAVVYENDPKLQSLVTHWFMHWELTTDPQRAETWHFFYHTFLPKHKSFTKEDLQGTLMMYLSKQHSEQHFGLNSTMLPGITRIILECYTLQESLGSLHIISKEGNQFTRSPESTKINFRIPNVDLRTAYAQNPN